MKLYTSLNMTAQKPKPPLARTRIGVTLGVLVSLGCWFSASPDEGPRIILLVTLDTLRADHLEIHGYPRTTAPRLSELARKGVWFTQAMAASSHTAPSHATILTGQYPHEHGVIANGSRLGARAVTMASLLANEGYATGAVTATKFLGRLASSFQHVDAARGNAQAITDRSTNWLAEVPEDRDVFLWVHYYDIHEWNDASTIPLDHREALRTSDRLEPAEIKNYVAELHALPSGDINGPDRPFTRETLLELIDDYDACIRYTDEQVGRLLDVVSQRFKNKILIVTADHGEGLGSHGITGHGVNLFEEQLHVPLILSAPELIARTGPVDALVHHVDLLATIADMVGSKVASPTRGRSLLPLLSQDTAEEWPDRILMAERRPFRNFWIKLWNAEPEEEFVVRKGELKLLVRTERGPLLFDLAADPQELQALDSTERGNELTTVARREGSKILSAVEPEIPTDLQEELRALGYLE